MSAIKEHSQGCVSQISVVMQVWAEFGGVELYMHYHKGRNWNKTIYFVLPWSFFLAMDITIELNKIVCGRINSGAVHGRTSYVLLTDCKKLVCTQITRSPFNYFPEPLWELKKRRNVSQGKCLLQWLNMWYAYFNHYNEQRRLCEFLKPETLSLKPETPLPDQPAHFYDFILSRIPRRTWSEQPFMI